MLLVLMPTFAKAVVNAPVGVCQVLWSLGVSHTLVAVFSLKVESAGPLIVDLALSPVPTVGLVYLSVV